jgi:hypothetical protein
MLFALNEFPPNWKPGAFQQVAALRVSYPQLRSAGLEFSTGDDELGVYDQAVVRVGTHPLILQHYTNPEKQDFSLEAPRDVAENAQLVSTLVKVVLRELAVSAEQITWRAANLDVAVESDALAHGHVGEVDIAKLSRQLARTKYWLTVERERLNVARRESVTDETALPQAKRHQTPKVRK